MPLHEVMLSCDLFQGEVAVGMRPALPVDGVTMILGNGIAGSRVWPDGAALAVVVSVPWVSSEQDQNNQDVPNVFRACAVTRSMERAQLAGINDNDHEVTSYCSLVCLSQRAGGGAAGDDSLKGFLEMARPYGEVKNYTLIVISSRTAF